MSYVNEDEYKGIITDDLKDKLGKASNQIDSMTFNRIVGAGFSNLTEFQQDKIKRAVCLQSDFMEQYGDYINSPISAFSAGSINVALNNNTVKNINGVITSSEVYDLLKQTGLTCTSFNY
ncbi:MAG: hypothetical protein SPJ62_16360 [Inconstantimicrobium porci]|uniref:hypothetical protein n=1 Tax=Inconstantimicrobium porci TaxID=2652291 RepID=UPI002A917275|nr:hypothetical protein [Inconstantimicrobium porci]MDY5913539.1 hypothetical protein [Inconstantimicrobium porci]